jgi:predicted NUDIX family NTP pyrophosphohydrolase
MAKRKSAGILFYRDGETEPEVFLVLHGGPFWVNKDAGAWSIPKGEFEDQETPLQAAIREFEEETGTLLKGDFTELKPVVQKAGKQVFAFAQKGDLDTATVHSNTFTMEWPPKSGKLKQFPEVAKAEWFPISIAREKINAAQIAFLDQLLQLLQT